MFSRMTGPVKPRRKYDSRRRREQAARTRQDIVTAAHDLFVEHGYVGATMTDIAAAAGVAVETIYRGFGSKAGLFEAVVEAAVAGGAARAMVGVEDRPAIRAVIDETDPRKQLALYAATQPGIQARIGPLVRVLKVATEVDEDLAAIWDQLEHQRLEGMGRFARLLAERGVLRPGLTADDARDILWTINSHAVYEKLVDQRGWSPERYEQWVADTLVATLLPRDGDVGA